MPYGHPWSVGNLEESVPLKKTDSPRSVMVKFNCQVDFEPPRNHTYEHFIESRHACVLRILIYFYSIGVWPECVSVYLVHTGPGRPEAIVESFITGVTDGV